MKKLFTVISVIIALMGCTSTHPVKQEDKSFDKVVEVSGFTKDQIYVASKLWLAQQFATTKDIIEIDNQEVGILLSNGSTTYPCDKTVCIATASWRVKFAMRIDMKDDKFKMSFSNINLTWPTSYSNNLRLPAHDAPVSAQDDMDKIKPQLLALSNELQAAILQSKIDSKW